MDLLKSKKFQAALVGLIVVILLHTFPQLPEEAISEVVALIVAYIFGQGVADFGKEAAKIKNGHK